MSEEDVQQIIQEIDTVLGYGGAWDAHRYLASLLEKLKELNNEQI